MSADPPSQSDELSGRQPDATPQPDEPAPDFKALFTNLHKGLTAEWQPEGFTEWEVVFELAKLYWQLGEIRPHQVTEGSKVAPAPKKDGDAEEAQGQESEEALISRATRLLWLGSPEEQVRRQRATFEDLIAKKIQQLMFLKTTKAKLRDLSSQPARVVEPDRVRLPRGDYRAPLTRTHQRSEAAAPSDQTTVGM